ncbi:MAG: formylglycine-generating enzyme family protein [Treponema sp.]|jgi:formylglycine-generating enzyme required for sulfatase activity|nr:formylglycine-generating enzyme family protein [Treponema sp.]
MRKLFVILFFSITAYIFSQSAFDGMVYVEGGTFVMGSQLTEPGRYDNEVKHRVMVNSFYIAKYEVTQEEYQDIMGTNPSIFTEGNLPVESVSWYEAIEYCNKLSEREGLIPVYKIDKLRRELNSISEYDNLRWTVTIDPEADGYRLPTEAEWEYAAKGGNKNSSDYLYSGGNDINAVAWYYKNSRNGSHPVGTKSPNSLGIYDMSGNVWEWCWDWYGDYYTSGVLQKNPAGASWGQGRVLRGGSWSNSVRSVRSAVRGYSCPSNRNMGFGFRIARSYPVN